MGFLIKFIPILLVIISSYYYENISKFIYHYLPENLLTKTDKELNKIKLFTTTELEHYNGIDKPQLYLAVLGIVFDVTEGSEQYSSGKSYNFFVGKDASRNFINGKFNENDANDDVIDLGKDELLSLKGWVGFYRDKYKEVGKLIGRFYDNSGQLTSYGRLLQELIKQAEKSKLVDEKQKERFPPCNVEWNQDKGTHVWCTKKSGGVSREWIGVPRKYYEPGSKEHRCACINKDDEQLGNIKEYEGCESTASDCYFKD